MKWAQKHGLNPKALLRAMSIRRQLAKYLERFEIPLVSCEDSASIRKCIASGFFPNCARLALGVGDGRQYQVLRGGTKTKMILDVHPNSVLFNHAPGCVVFHEGMFCWWKFLILTNFNSCGVHQVLYA